MKPNIHFTGVEQYEGVCNTPLPFNEIIPSSAIACLVMLVAFIIGVC